MIWSLRDLKIWSVINHQVWGSKLSLLTRIAIPLFRYLLCYIKWGTPMLKNSSRKNRTQGDRKRSLSRIFSCICCGLRAHFLEIFGHRPMHWNIQGMYMVLHPALLAVGIRGECVLGFGKWDNSLLEEGASGRHMVLNTLMGHEGPVNCLAVCNERE